MKTNSTQTLSRKLHIIIFLPLLLLCLLFSVFSALILTYFFEENTEKELQIIVDTLAHSFDLLYPGDYVLVGGSSYQIYKGEHLLSDDYTVLDDFYEENGIHLTLFYEDTRILTTICDSDGNRIIGTGANPLVISDVLLNGVSKFYTDMTINGESFYAYYKPLYNSNGTVSGMFFAGIPKSNLFSMLQVLVIIVSGVSLAIALLLAIPTSYYIKNIVHSLKDLSVFLNKISTGNLSAAMPINTLKRKDELGMIGHSAITMQTSLKSLIEQDSLTKLYNRRYADKILQQVQAHAKAKETHFALVIADIDFFKKINDTYGHNCGDFVLQEIASTLRSHMAGNGYAIRWGGEEFVLLYSNINHTFTDTSNSLERLMADIRNLILPWGNEMIHVTMTFGVVRGDSSTNIHALLQEADKQLYFGKENGRDQIIY